MIQAALDLALPPADDDPPHLGGRGRLFYVWKTPRPSSLHELRAADKAAAVDLAATAFGREPYLVLPAIEEA